MIESVPLTDPAAVPFSNVTTIGTAAPIAAVVNGLEATENVKTSPATYPVPGLLMFAAVVAPPATLTKSNVKPTPATEVVPVGATFASVIVPAPATQAELVVISAVATDTPATGVTK
jgi:hypothetical protein